MAGFCICLIKVSQGFEYASGFNYATAQNMERLYARATQGSLIIPQYVLVCLNNA